MCFSLRILSGRKFSFFSNFLSNYLLFFKNLLFFLKLAIYNKNQLFMCSLSFSRFFSVFFLIYIYTFQRFSFFSTGCGFVIRPNAWTHFTYSTSQQVARACCRAWVYTPGVCILGAFCIWTTLISVHKEGRERPPLCGRLPNVRCCQL